MRKSEYATDIDACLEYGHGVIQTAFVLGIITKKERREYWDDLDEITPYLRIY